MRALRYITALLFVLNGVLHTLPFFSVPRDPYAFPMLAFGIIYFTIGTLLILKLKISPLMGIIFPLIGIATGIFVIGSQSLTIMLTIMFAIDVIVILCCSAIFFTREKQKADLAG